MTIQKSNYPRNQLQEHIFEQSLSSLFILCCRAVHSFDRVFYMVVEGGRLGTTLCFVYWTRSQRS